MAGRAARFRVLHTETVVAEIRDCQLLTRYLGSRSVTGYRDVESVKLLKGKKDMFNRTSVTKRSLVGGGLVVAMTFAILLQHAVAQSAQHDGGPGMAAAVSGSVDQTVDRLKKMVADNGMMVMGEIHPGKVLAMTGLKLKSETIFVGSPTVGKKLFTAEPGAGLAVPVRVNIYQDAHGHTVVRYVPLSAALSAFNNPELDKVAKMVDQKLQNMVSMLPKQ